jgi:ribonuclease P protein component
MDAAGVPRSRPPGGRRGRLTRSSDFDRVYRQGRSFANRYLAVYSFPRAGEGGTRLGLSVGRKVGAAVDRNRVKRLLREAFASRRDAIAVAHDVVIVARPDALELAEREGLEGLASALDELLERAGVLTSSGAAS